MRIRVIFLIALSIVLVHVPALAQGSEPHIPNPPPAGTYIFDELNWLSSYQETEINTIIAQLDKEGLAEIAVVTLTDCGTDKQAFRKSLFNTWGIGHSNDNDGLLILVCWYGGDKTRRSVEQEFGSGLNKILTGELTNQIAQENFTPAFEQERPGDGLISMVRAYNSIIRGSTSPSNSKRQSTPDTAWNDSGGLMALLLVGIIIAGIALYPWLQSQGLIKPSNSQRDHWSDRSDSGDSSFGGGDSDGGRGSSTKF